MPVVMLLAVIVVLVAVFFVATGRGGELSREHPDYAPLDLGPVSATDIALVRPPTALFGYNVKVTDEALDLIARAMRGRDAKIAYLQAQLAAITPETAQDPQLPLVPRPVSALPNLQAHQVPRDLPAPLAQQVPRDLPAPQAHHLEPQDQDDTQILQALYELRTPQTDPEGVAHEEVTQRLDSYAALPFQAARSEAEPSETARSETARSETAPFQTAPFQAARSETARSETGPAEAGQLGASEDPETGQHPADHQDSVGEQRPAAAEDIVPWDEPAGQENLPAASELRTQEHPEHRSDLTAGESPTESRAGD